MNQYKDLNLKIDINNKKKRVESTGSLFFSYDINAIRVIAEITKDKQTLDDDLSVKLVLQSSDFSGRHKEGFLIHLDSKTKDSKVTFDLPNEILSYQGYVRMDFYVDYETGSNDAAQAYMFELRKSQIDKSVNNFEFAYISDFEQAKKEVLEAQQEALKSIEGVSHELDTTINETRLKIEARPQELNADITQAQSDIASKVDTVESSKTQAQTTISGYVESVEQSKTTAETNISNNVKNVSDKQTEALNSIDTSVSDVQTKQAQVNDNFTKAIQDVEQAKTTAQSKIASQTDLSADVATAKESMSESVVDVQNTADYEKAQIEAIRPKLESDIAFVKENAETIKAKGFLEKPKLAWANSEDMTVDFTTFKTNSNLLKNTKTFQGYYKASSVIQTTDSENFVTRALPAKKTAGPESLIETVLPKLEIGWYTVSFESSGTVLYAYLLNTQSIKYIYDVSLNVLEKNQTSSITRKMNLTSDRKRYSISFYVNQTTSNASFIYRGNDIGDSGTLLKLKLSGGIDFLYLANKEEDYANSFMKFYATSNIDSTNPSNYTQGRYTDEYIDYKLQQLTNAVVTNAGGA